MRTETKMTSHDHCRTQLDAAERDVTEAYRLGFLDYDAFAYQLYTIYECRREIAFVEPGPDS